MSTECEQVRELAPDLALGLLTGRERAACLAHLEACGACRAEVSALAVTADEVLLAGPRATPAPGFAGRVLCRLDRARAAKPTERLAPTRRAPGRRARLVAGAAAGLAAVAAGVAGLAGPGSTPAPPAAVRAEMRTGTGQLVGDVSVEGGGPAVVTVELPGWSDLVDHYGSPGAAYWLAVELDDGSRTMNRISGRRGPWEVPLRAAADEVAAVAVVDGEGRAWCMGRFGA